MYYKITGPIFHKDPSFVVIDCQGVGYKLFTTLNTLGQLGQVGETITLYTFLNVREDALDLYGFASVAEEGCFRMLLSVSGVGPKAALSILSNLTPERFALAVAAEDAKALKAPGVGPKIAQRIILELKDKMKNQDISAGVKQSGNMAPIGTGNLGEAVGALLVLGYSQGEAASVLSSADPKLPVEELIKQALKKLAIR